MQGKTEEMKSEETEQKGHSFMQCNYLSMGQSGSKDKGREGVVGMRELQRGGRERWGEKR